MFLHSLFLSLSFIWEFYLTPTPGSYGESTLVNEKVKNLLKNSPNSVTWNQGPLQYGHGFLCSQPHFLVWEMGINPISHRVMMLMKWIKVCKVSSMRLSYSRVSWPQRYWLWKESCLVHWRVLRSIPVLYPLDAYSTTPAPVVITENVSRHWETFPGTQ